MAHKIDVEFLQHIIVLLKRVTDDNESNSKEIISPSISKELVNIDDKVKNLNSVEVQFVSNQDIEKNKLQPPKNMEMFPCNLCDKKFRLQILLNSHLKIHNLMSRTAKTNKTVNSIHIKKMF